MSVASKAVRLRIEGRVQGVGYRAWFESAASRNNVCGTVRNRADGSVEAICAGAPNAIEALRRACLAGPSGAHVTCVNVEELSGAEAIAALAAKRVTRLPTA